MTETIKEHYTDFYKDRNPVRVYPTEFVVRTFLAKYPELNFKPEKGGKLLDLGFGDGRNMCFLIEQGYELYGTEITQDIVDLTANRLNQLGMRANLKVGRNTDIPFEDGFFDVLLGCHVVYYCDLDKDFSTNLKEIARVLKPGGWLVASLVDKNTYMFDGAEEANEPGHVIVQNDPYNNRNGSKFRAFESEKDIKDTFSELFENFSIGKAHNNYYGIDERVFWLTCQKK